MTNVPSVTGNKRRVVRRILHCIPNMDGGGAERQLAYLCRGLSQLGWHSHVALFHEGANIQRLRNSGAIIHTMDTLGSFDPINVWRVHRLIRKIRPTLVQTWLPMIDIIGGIACKMLHVPHILSERASWAAYPPTWRTELRNRVGRHADSIISNSAEGDAYWGNVLGTKRIQRFTIPNALPIHEIASAEPAPLDELNVAPDRRIVLYIGRFHVHKNTEVMLRALHQVVTTSNTSALLFGDGPERPRMEELIKAMGSSSDIKVRGYHFKVWSILKRASVFISVSHNEGMPNTVMEAMACGCPIVVSDIPQHRAILDGTCATLVDPDNPDAIAKAIADVLRDSEESRRKAQIAKERTAQWSIENMARRYSSSYEEIANAFYAVRH